MIVLQVCLEAPGEAVRGAACRGGLHATWPPLPLLGGDDEEEGNVTDTT